MGRECCTHGGSWGGQRELRTEFWCLNLKARYFLGDLGAGNKIILKRILNKYDGNKWIGYGWLWIGTKWRVLVNVIMNLRVVLNVRNILTC